MNTGTLLTAASRSLCAGLLVLAGVLSGADSPARAQEDCPLPAGITPPDPQVTAQDAESDSTRLEDFALELRAQLKSQSQAITTLEQVAYFGCLVRQEGGPWRSGSTYIVQLTPDGRIFVHAKNMALSGRLLHPLIYAQILSALGVSPTDLANLRDPANAAGAFESILLTLSREPAALFDAGTPGASGHAGVYVSPNLGLPLLVLTGFDLNSSHLAQEDVDYGDPSITARDVVDRATLKEFVTAAGNYFIAAQQTGDVAALSKARVALRDPNGPWRHGSVYLYVLDRTNNIVLVHATDPDRFELYPLVGRARDGRTGELILPQVIAAATSSPEGGFVEYYYDDPADDTDRADIPKVGYAREFVSVHRRQDGSTFPLNYIIGSGFYGSPTEAVAEDGNAVIESALPQVMRAMTASTVDAVSGRIRQATSDTPPARELKLAGASTLSDILLTHGQALQNGTFDPNRLFANSSFTVPLNAAGAEGGGLLRDLTFWGSGDYRNLSGGSRQGVDYDGNVASANLGIDTRLSADLLAGMSVARAQGTVDYTDTDARTGELTTTLTSVNPYVGWQSPGGMNLWATAGYGSGEVEIDGSTGREASDLTQQMVAAGVNGPLMASDQVIEGGTTILRLKGETAFTRADIDGSGILRSMTLNASRQRLTLEGSHAQELASGATFTPSLEIGMRHDGGDGETGNGVETGGGVRYADAASGLTLEGRALTLLAHSGDYEEWGVSGLVRLDPGAGGRGLALSAQPAWGRTASGVQRLWEAGATGEAVPDDHAAGRLNARLAYGIGAGRGVLTPYTDVSLSVEGLRHLSLGGRLDIGPSVRMILEGVHSRRARGAADRGVMLRGSLH
ncbi:MAG: autotransporter domain-containing protein [Alphaproteobacteria bacterium]|nr:autotransporter domain-containing protein [Alphaproteobacteria bacterium]